MKRALALGGELLSANRRVFRWLGAHLPQSREDAHRMYRRRMRSRTGLSRKRGAVPCSARLFRGTQLASGSKVYYDYSYASVVLRILERHGFIVSKLRVALYELVVRALGLTNLAAYIVVVAERRSD